MTTEEIMGNEAEQLIDYLTSYLDNIYKTAGPTLQNILKRWNCTSDYDLHSILEDSIERFYFCYSVPPDLSLSVYLNYGECETKVDMIDDDSLDDWSVNDNGYAYYTTYGFMVELNANKLHKELKEYTEEKK